jgi:aminoglycoside phosphotransferase (APT) family kinase protein
MRNSIEALADEIAVSAVMEVWETALAAPWQGPPVWVHGDIAAGNLLVSEARLCAVIDFGCLGVGDPSCDLVIAWTFLDSAGREAFRDAHSIRQHGIARGWAIWKALITLVKYRKAEKQHKVIRDIMDDRLASATFTSPCND